jgi:membrane protease YdiL (CAAX protease family)
MTAPSASAWVRRRPAAAFFALTYAISWGLWLPLVLGYGGPLRPVLFTAGVFGPALAGALATRLMGRSVRTWLREVVRWRVPARWWAAALLLPVALTLAASAAYALAGPGVDWGLLPGRLAAYVPALVAACVLGGGQEEFGWRGFALGHLERRWGPVRGTLILGVAWALWHLPGVAATADLRHGLDAAAFLPVLGLTVLSVVGYAFLLTWVMNRTGSVLVAVLLHGGFNTANGALVPLPEAAVEGDAYAALSVAVLAVLAVAVGAVLVATRGRLGYDAAPPPGGDGAAGGPVLRAAPPARAEGHSSSAPGPRAAQAGRA